MSKDRPSTRRASRLSAMIVCCLASATMGCAHKHGILGVDRCADIPCGAIPEPPGTKVCNWQNAQVHNALADQGVMHLADFVGRTATLSPAALERLSRNIDSGLAPGLVWVVEPSGDADLDAERVESVADTLSTAGLMVSAEEVQIATPAALGISGAQAERIGIGASRAISRGSNLGGRGGRGARSGRGGRRF